MYDRHELLVPGWWSWMGIFHSTSIGQFITLLATLSITEIVRPKRSTWPWICCAGSAPLMLVASTWGISLCHAPCSHGSGLVLVPEAHTAKSARGAARPGPYRGLPHADAAYYLTSSTPIHGLVSGEEHTQNRGIPRAMVADLSSLVRFAFGLPQDSSRGGHRPFRSSPGVFARRILHGRRPLRHDGEIWGFIFCAAWATFLPAIATSRSRVFRLLFSLIVINSALSFCYWTSYYWQTIDPKDLGEMEGKGDLFYDPSRGPNPERAPAPEEPNHHHGRIVLVVLPQRPHRQFLRKQGLHHLEF